MADMSEFDQANRQRHKPSKVQVILEDLDDSNPDRAEMLRSALADRTYTSTAIARVLVSWGYDISPDSVQKWRRYRG